MWLLAAAVRQAIEQAYRQGMVPTVEQQAQYEARYGFTGEGEEYSRVLTTAGDVAEIRVAGVITKTPNFLAMLFGGGNVTYPEIISALAQADKDPEVKRADLRISSPGGTIDGLYDTLTAIKNFSKPIRAVVEDKASSAAYSMAAQADEIVAANRASRVGSVGVVGSFEISENLLDIANTDSPKKRPDVTTEEGQAVVREQLDAIHDLFAEAIAEGRKTTAEKVSAEYGQGAELLADEALKRGMIDSIAEAPLRVVKSSRTTTTASSGGTKLPETGPMNLSELKAQHPDVYAEAMQEGVTHERNRVSAHLEMGEAAEALDIAVKAIKEGEEYTPKHMASYNAAALRKTDQRNRQDDDKSASGADGAEGGEAVDVASEAVVSIVEGHFGIERENVR